jgi:hypothetical protein
MRNSLYDISNTQGSQIKNQGFDYKSNTILLKKTMSPNMFRNDELAGFLEKLNEIMLVNIESVKNVRIHNNFTVSKNTKYIN